MSTETHNGNILVVDDTPANLRTLAQEFDVDQIKAVVDQIKT